MSSPNHALDSPVSDDYSTASAGVLDSNSIGGIGSGDVIASNFKSNYKTQEIIKDLKKKFPEFLLFDIERDNSLNCIQGLIRNFNLRYRDQLIKGRVEPLRVYLISVQPSTEDHLILLSKIAIVIGR